MVEYKSINPEEKMKKQKSDAGLSYLKMTGLRAAKDKGSIQKEFEGTFGKKEGGDFLADFYKLAEKGDKNSYEFKNEDYDKCMLLTGCFDADIIRRSGNWIANHKEYFGKKILDVGCDCGVISCFLGVQFPESEIVSIDRSVNGIKIGEKLAKKLGLKNIRFVSAELKDFDEGGFDTVFSMRTAMENGFCKEDRTMEFVDQAEAFGAAFKDYASLLASKVEENGFLVSLENTERDPLLLGWIDALFSGGLKAIKDGYTEFSCRELGNEVPFQTLVLKKGSEGSAMDFFTEICEDNGDFSLGDYKGWRSKLVYEFRKGDLIEGYFITGTGAEKGSVFSLWTCIDNPDAVVFFQSHEGESFVQLAPLKQKNIFIDVIHEVVDSAKGYTGLEVTKLQ